MEPDEHKMGSGLVATLGLRRNQRLKLRVALTTQHPTDFEMAAIRNRKPWRVFIVTKGH